MRQFVSLLVTAAAVALVSAPPTQAQVGAPFCQGVGCPCGNDDPDRGCGNRGDDFATHTGALLLHTGGNASALQDSLEFTVFGLASNQFGVLFMGGGASQFTFGDGLRCVVSGGRGVHRFAPQQGDFFGEFTISNVVSKTFGFPGNGPIDPGESWNFQVWYRDPGGPCGTSFNLTNAIPVDFYATGGGGDHDELAGRPLTQYPWFEYVRTFNQGETVSLAIDPGLKPALSGVTADVYVVAAKDLATWGSDPSLTDVRGGPSQHTFNGLNVEGNTFTLDAGLLNGTTGAEVGIGYDVVIDVNGDGQYDPGDLIDGLSDEAGFYVVRDVAAPGPYTVIETQYTFGSFRGQDTYYPSNIASLGRVPLVVVSHGNGHDYRWYDHIGYHLASYGYVVMSHQNQTGPGIESASTTTLENTEDFLGNLGAIDGGVLSGHIDSSRITWIGHSRGGEGVVRAYTRLVNGYNVSNYSASDIQLISSIAPVTFLSATNSNPGDVNYHLWVGSADNDVYGVPTQTHMYALMERAAGNRSSITLQGAGHGAFHDGTGPGSGLVASGPCLLTRAETHEIMRGQLLPLVKHYIEGDVPSKDFLWRQWEGFKPLGAPPLSNPCVVVTLDYRDGPAAANLVLEDFETNTSTGLSSSGTPVNFDVVNLTEADKRDADNSFATGPAMNGMTRSISTDTHRGVVFEWSTPSYWEVLVDPLESDLSDDAYLSFRAAQCTRHPNTTAALGDLDFLVTLRDANGVSSSISVTAFGGGIEEPYQRSGSQSGPGTGWHNEMETIRIRLSDFLANGSGINLFLIDAVRFDFGGSAGDAVGRLGLDDIEITKD